jgi:hypothetical protein
MQCPEMERGVEGGKGETALQVGVFYQSEEGNFVSGA